MKVQIVRPFAAEKEVGEAEQHYGVVFTVAETGSKKSVLVADVPEEEAQAMIDAGRVVAADDEGADLPDEEAQDGQPARRGRKPKGE